MQNKMFLVNFQPSKVKNQAREFCAFGWNVDFESQDENRAFSHISQLVPDLIVIDWSGTGSRGHELGKKLCNEKNIRDCPLIFLVPENFDVEKEKEKVDCPSALFMPTSDLLKTLTKLPPELQRRDGEPVWGRLKKFFRKN